MFDARGDIIETQRTVTETGETFLWSERRGRGTSGDRATTHEIEETFARARSRGNPRRG